MLPKKFWRTGFKKRQAGAGGFLGKLVRPCMMLAPTIAEIADEYADTVKVAKINVDDAQELALSFGVESIPTLMVFKDGKMINTSVGGRSKEQIVEMFEDL